MMVQIGIKFLSLKMQDPYDMTKLMEISIESGRTTHHNPLGYLGSYVAALFTAFAIQEVHPNRWLSLLLSKHLP
jgi:ADP-ribosylarginine hydrolase